MIRHAETSIEHIRQLIKSGAIELAGNSQLKIYGLLSCTSGKRMKRENRVFFESEKEAKQLGYRPCGRCIPKKYHEWKSNKAI